MKPVFLINNPDTVISPSNPNYNHSMAPAQYPYADAYFGGLFTPYGQPAFLIRFRPRWEEEVHQHEFRYHLIMLKMPPVYVNAKQYNGILRRRPHCAKLEAQNKLVKSRKL